MRGIAYRNIQPFRDSDYEKTVDMIFGDTTASAANGGNVSTTIKKLQPMFWMKDVIDAAQKKFRYANHSKVQDIPKGNAYASFTKRKQYLSGSAWASSVTPGTAVNYTTLNNFTTVEVQPSWKNYAHAITYDTIYQTLVDYVAAGKRELSYRAGDEVDQAIVTAISGATKASASTVGAQSVYGGDATQCSELANGDIITTGMIAEANRKLKTDVVRYWVGGTGESALPKTTAVKNAWENDRDFTLFISPEQEEALLTDSQFVNADIRGNADVIENGEIGSYLKIKVLSSVNTHQVASGGSGTVDGTSAGTDMNTCVLMKDKVASALAYLKRPTLHVVDYPSELEVRLIMEQAYGTGVIHEDAIVYLNVSQV